MAVKFLVMMCNRTIQSLDCTTQLNSQATGTVISYAWPAISVSREQEGIQPGLCPIFQMACWNCWKACITVFLPILNPYICLLIITFIPQCFKLDEKLLICVWASKVMIMHSHDGTGCVYTRNDSYRFLAACLGCYRLTQWQRERVYKINFLVFLCV